MISRSQTASSVLKTRPIYNAMAHDTRRSMGCKVDSESANLPSDTKSARTMHTGHPTHQAIECPSFNMRTGVPLSSWDPDTPSHPWGSRRPKVTPKTHDTAISAYYVERRKQHDGTSQRKEAEGDLMSQLSAGILSEGIAAQTRARERKIPVEVIEADGTVRYPSGFEPPTPTSDFHPIVTAQKLDDEGCDIGTIAKVSWDQAL